MFNFWVVLSAEVKNKYLKQKSTHTPIPNINSWVSFIFHSIHKWISGLEDSKASHTSTSPEVGITWWPTIMHMRKSTSFYKNSTGEEDLLWWIELCFPRNPIYLICIITRILWDVIFMTPFCKWEADVQKYWFSCWSPQNKFTAEVKFPFTLLLCIFFTLLALW